MKVKNENVNVKGLTMNMLVALGLIEEAAKRHLGNDYEVTITSAKDGKHMPGSKHYTGNAIDIRTKDMKDKAGIVVIAIDTELNLRNDRHDYDVILENDHIHIEYDPKDNKH